VWPPVHILILSYHHVHYDYQSRVPTASHFYTVQPTDLAIPLSYPNQNQKRVTQTAELTLFPPLFDPAPTSNAHWPELPLAPL
jgi:hypothetical protein